MNSRRVIGVSVLAIWVLMVGWHVRREYFVPEASGMAMGARTLAPDDALVRDPAWVACRSAWRSRDWTRCPTAYVFNDEMTLDVPALGQVHRATARTQHRSGSRAGAAQGFDFRSTPDRRVRVSGRPRVTALSR
jgi:hypothetical protein